MSTFAHVAGDSADFVQLLLKPDVFKANYGSRHARGRIHDRQIPMPFLEVSEEFLDPAYNDLSDEDMGNLFPEEDAE